MKRTSFFLQALIAAAVLAPGLASAAPPEGKVQINYNRCDSNYDG
jgi:hypothetical protein